MNPNPSVMQRSCHGLNFRRPRCVYASQVWAQNRPVSKIPITEVLCRGTHHHRPKLALVAVSSSTFSTSACFAGFRAGQRHEFRHVPATILKILVWFSSIFWVQIPRDFNWLKFYSNLKTCNYIYVNNLGTAWLIEGKIAATAWPYRWFKWGQWTSYKLNQA